MDRSEALDALADEWRKQGKVGGPPTLWDLAVALARAHAFEGEDPRPAIFDAGAEGT